MEFNDFQQIKRKFFSYRNGVTADALRKGGSPFQIIFGLTIPQLSEIAQETGLNRELALKLWNNGSTRCSMLLAPMIMPSDGFGIDEALEWCSNVPAYEVADILCMKLLSKTSYVNDLIPRLLTGGRTERYIALRLMLRMLKDDKLKVELSNFIKDMEIIERGEFPVLEQQIREELDNDGK